MARQKKKTEVDLPIGILILFQENEDSKQFARTNSHQEPPINIINNRYSCHQQFWGPKISAVSLAPGHSGTSTGSKELVQRRNA